MPTSDIHLKPISCLVFFEYVLHTHRFRGTEVIPPSLTLATGEKKLVHTTHPEQNETSGPRGLCQFATAIPELRNGDEENSTVKKEAIITTQVDPYVSASI